MRVDDVFHENRTDGSVVIDRSSRVSKYTLVIITPSNSGLTGHVIDLSQYQLVTFITGWLSQTQFFVSLQNHETQVDTACEAVLMN